MASSGCLAARPSYLLQKSLKRSLLLLVWTELQWRVSAACRDCQQVRENRRALMHVVCRQSEHRLELIELLFGKVLPPYSRCPFKEPNDRVQRAVGMERRTEMAQGGVRHARELVAQGPHEAGFADAWFAAEQDDLSLSLFRLLPAVQEKCEFVVAPDQRGRRHSVLGVEPALGRPLADDEPCPHRSRKTLEEEPCLGHGI